MRNKKDGRGNTYKEDSMELIWDPGEDENEEEELLGDPIEEVGRFIEDEVLTPDEEEDDG